LRVGLRLFKVLLDGVAPYKLKSMKTTRSAGGVVTNTKATWLVVSQHGTSWSLPRDISILGKVRWLQRGVRSTKRAGFAIWIWSASGTYERFRIGVDGGDDRSELKVITMFLFRTSEKGFRPVDPDIRKARWVERAKVASLLTMKGTRDFSSALRSERSGEGNPLRPGFSGASVR